MFIGNFIAAFGFVLMAYTDSIIQLFFAYFFVSFGSALSGWLPTMTLMNLWFRKNRSFAMAFSITGTHIGGWIAPLLALSLINFGIKNFETYKDFSKKIQRLKKNVIKNISNLKKHNKIIGFGSPAKATTFLNFYGLNDKFLDFTIEDNKLKQNKFIPGADIPIKKPVSKKIKNSLLIVLAWNYFNEIKAKNLKYFNKIISIKDLENDKLNI
mgnify:CR=1 FL=1